MNITSKSRYALKILMDLAYHHQDPHVHREDISRRQGVPQNYLDQIMLRLRKAKLVDSVRGRGGGYRLAKAPQDIMVFEIFGAVEDALFPVECLSDARNCGYEDSCVSTSAWGQIFSAMVEPLKAMSLKQLVSNWAQAHQMCPMGGIKECRKG